MINFVLVMLAMIAVDAAWTRYLIDVQDRRPVLAGLWSAAIVGLGAFVVVSYVHDPWLVLAAAVGGFIGTTLTVKWSKR